jgi:endonuclease/exonuclease/phosphatase family metal-dependent hydrolase
MRVRVVSYNIMQGGEGRADPLAETLLGRKPDIVGIHEADNQDVLRRLSDRLEMDFVVGQSDGGNVALFTRHRIVSSVNISLFHRTTMPILDVTLLVEGRLLKGRVAHLKHKGEGDRMAQRLAELVPDFMMMSYEPPLGTRVIDGTLTPGHLPVPAQTHVPVRHIDQVLVQRHLRYIEGWIEQDRLAYYASDHLPSGVEFEVT